MKYLPNTAGALLGILFVLFASIVLFHIDIGPMPVPEPESTVDHFNKAFQPTGYVHFVKWLELIGGILVAVPRTRNFGLLILGPILINIIAFHVFIAGGAKPMEWAPVVGVLSALALYLLWVGRREFLGLLRSPTHTVSTSHLS